MSPSSFGHVTKPITLELVVHCIGNVAAETAFHESIVDRDRPDQNSNVCVQAFRGRVSGQWNNVATRRGPLHYYAGHASTPATYLSVGGVWPLVL